MEPFKIERVFAFISEDKLGREGVCAFYDRTNDVWVPMIGADNKRVESLRSIAKDMIRHGVTNKIKLVYFQKSDEFEEI